MVTTDQQSAQMLRQQTREMLASMPPDQRDRMFQRHLALARGKRQNLILYRRMTALLLRTRQFQNGATEMSDDPVLDVVATVTTALDAAGVPYALTGSVASAVHGEPWVSQNANFVVRMTPDRAGRLAESLPARFYRDRESLIEAATQNGMANLIDQNTGLKVDLSILSPGAFHDQIFLRRQKSDLGGTPQEFYIVSPEDIILMKLEWRKDSRSAKQWENALGVARNKGARLDWKYLFDQAGKLGVTDDLIELRDQAGV